MSHFPQSAFDRLLSAPPRDPNRLPWPMVLGVSGSFRPATPDEARAYEDERSRDRVFVQRLVPASGPKVKFRRWSP